MNSFSILEERHSIPQPAAGHISIKLNKVEQAVIFCYENEVPPFAEAALERLYGNYFSTILHLSESGRMKNASTYVALARGNISAVFLFEHHHGEIHVLNEVIRLDQSAVRQFSDYIFSTYGSVHVISFHAVDTHIKDFQRPYQRINCLEDIVLTLPDSVDEYTARLGKSTRKTIKGYANKLRRDFPSFHNQTYEKDEANEQQIRTIIEMNRERLLTNGKISTFDEDAVKRIIRSAKKYGTTCVATIDGKICAGSISYRVGENYFMHVSAHDQAFDDYRLGTLYRYLTICECIRKKARECHFLWGRQEYKYSLLGVKRDLHDLVIFRSRAHFLLRSDVVVQTLLKASRRQGTLLMRAWKERTGGSANLAAKFMSKLGMARQSA